MNERIRALAREALEGKGGRFSDDENLKKRLFAAAEQEKLNMIAGELPSVINVNEYTLLAGDYPGFDFWGKKYPIPDSSFRDKYKQLHKQFIQGGNHKAADYGFIIKNGIKGYEKKIRDARERYADDEEKITFLEDLSFLCEAISAWTEANARACERKAEEEGCRKRKQELLHMAALCRKVPMNPAENFYEAVQSYFFIFLLFPDGLGRPDQYFYPYYRMDMEKGNITREFALELIENLFIRIFQVQDTQESFFKGWSGYNHGVIGGYTDEGMCGHNDITSIILEALCDLPTWRPQISYRYTDKTSHRQMREVCEANYKRPDVIMFLNDEVIVENLVMAGVSRKDAIQYSVSGCNETVVTGCSQMGALEGHVNLMYCFEQVITNVPVLEKIVTFEDFYKAIEVYFREELELAVSYSYERAAAEAVEPDLVKSLFTAGCIEKAAPITRGGAKYNNSAWCLTGLINLANSLSIIKQMVFEERYFTLKELSEFLKADWKGYEEVRAYIIKHGRYFGNDDDYADCFINKIAASLCEIVKDRVPYRGGRYMFGTLTGYELSHVEFGKECMASPDGRHAGEALAASVAAYPSSDRNGLTAYLKSAGKIDGGLIGTSVVVNLSLDRAVADTEEKRDLLASIIETYFRLGGVQLQINYLSVGELRKAQQSPDAYRNLRVRVTGFSGFFTEFDRELQDEIIERALQKVN